MLCLWVSVSMYSERSCGLHRKGVSSRNIRPQKMKAAVFPVETPLHANPAIHSHTPPTPDYPKIFPLPTWGPGGQLPACPPSPATDGLLPALSKGCRHVPLMYFSLPYSLTVPRLLSLSEPNNVLTNYIVTNYP